MITAACRAELSGCHSPAWPCVCHAGTWGRFRTGPSKPYATACFYQMGGRLYYNTGAYLCACYTSSFTLTWSTSASCATSTAYAAATKPGVCVYSKYGTTQVSQASQAGVELAPACVPNCLAESAGLWGTRVQGQSPTSYLHTDWAARHLAVVQAWVMGWSTDGRICRSGSFPYGKNGAWVNTITQGATGHTVRFLCKAKGAAL